jgi:hypothetical protein
VEPPESPPAAGRRDRGWHAAGLRVDLLDAIRAELEQVPAVEGRAGIRGDLDRAQRLPARRIEAISRSPAANQTFRPSYVTPRTWSAPRRAILADDLGGGSTHASILVGRQGRGE